MIEMQTIPQSLSHHPAHSALPLSSRAMLRSFDRQLLMGMQGLSGAPLP